MKTLLVTAALVASASAFAPARDVRVSTSVDAFANGYVGGEGPEPMLIGGSSKNWDPIGFSEVGILQVILITNDKRIKVHKRLLTDLRSVCFIICNSALPNGSHGSVKPN
jgi:hypothetical protein